MLRPAVPHRKKQPRGVKPFFLAVFALIFFLFSQVQGIMKDDCNDWVERYPRKFLPEEDRSMAEENQKVH